MTATVTTHATPPDRAEAALRQLGLAPSRWSAGPRAPFADHSHALEKVLFCIEGSITFRTPDGELAMAPGDRLDLPAGTAHSALAGRCGVVCVEAFR
jgi:quercetin dioxygenase-like cupin family protein